MMQPITHLLSTFLRNALWQLPLVLVATLLAARLLHPLGPLVQHRLWVASLLLQCVLPALSLAPLPSLPAFNRLFLHTPIHTRISVAFGPAALLASTLPTPLVTTLLLLWAALTLAFTARLLLGLRTLATLRRHAVPAALNPVAALAWNHARTSFGLRTLPTVALSSHIDSPLTLGLRRPLILLPQNLLDRLAEPELRTVFAHECAHIRRHDFRSNLLLQILSLPLAFHPAFALTRARLLESREWVCDAEAARTLAGPRPYAASLLRLAALVLSTATPPAPAVGLFNRSTLERRIMQLTQSQNTCSRPRRFGRLVASAALALGTAATALALGLPALGNDASPAAVPHATPLHVRSDVMAGNVLTRVPPTYPEDAKSAKIQGAVRLQTTISATGAIQNLRVLSGPPELRISALTAVNQWTYKPYLLNGDPVPVQTVVTINYSLAP